MNRSTRHRNKRTRLWQRSNELAEYYHHVLQPAGEIPVVVYPIFPIEMKARGPDWPERKGDLLQYLKGSPTPTLIASIYGMNFEHMPELHWLWGYPFAIGLMVAGAVLPYWYFKRRKWL